MTIGRPHLCLARGSRELVSRPAGKLPAQLDRRARPATFPICAPREAPAHLAGPVNQRGRQSRRTFRPASCLPGRRGNVSSKQAAGQRRIVNTSATNKGPAPRAPSGRLARCRWAAGCAPTPAGLAGNPSTRIDDKQFPPARLVVDIFLSRARDDPPGRRLCALPPGRPAARTARTARKSAGAPESSITIIINDPARSSGAPLAGEQVRSLFE